MQTNDKLREALADALNKVNDAYDILSRPCVTLEEARQACREARGIIIPALSAPLRNCDVGTLTEQQQRFHEYCEKMQHTDKACCGGCPIVELRMNGTISNSCELAWAQMPYEAEKGAGK